MTKRKIFIIAAGILTVSSITSCSIPDNDISIDTEQNSTLESVDVLGSEEDLQLPDDLGTEKEKTINEDSKNNSESVNISDMFASDSPDFQIREVSFSGPMCTGLVIENLKKKYGKTMDEDYPQIEFNSGNDFNSIGWWPEGSKVYLQFWNINNKKEVEFSIDEVKCKLLLPEAAYDEIELNIVTDNLNIPCRFVSLYRYDAAAVLNMEVSKDDFSNLQTVRLKMQDTERSPSRIHFDDIEGKIAILYLFGDSNLSDAFSKHIQGIVYGDECIFIE